MGPPRVSKVAGTSGQQARRGLRTLSPWINGRCSIWLSVGGSTSHRSSSNGQHHGRRGGQRPHATLKDAAAGEEPTPHENSSHVPVAQPHHLSWHRDPQVDMLEERFDFCRRQQRVPTSAFAVLKLGAGPLKQAGHLLEGGCRQCYSGRYAGQRGPMMATPPDAAVAVLPRHAQPLEERLASSKSPTATWTMPPEASATAATRSSATPGGRHIFILGCRHPGPSLHCKGSACITDVHENRRALIVMLKGLGSTDPTHRKCGS